MRNIKILINEDHSVEFDNDYAGLNQENLQGNITFSFKNFVDGQARAEVILDNDGEYEDGYILLDKVGQTYTMPIKSSLLNCKSIIMQLVIDLPGSFIITTDTHINTNKTYYQKLNDNYVVVENPNQHDLPTYYEASVPVWKSETFTLKVGFSINATSTIPEDYPSWIETLNNLIEEVDQAVEEANNLDLDMTNENGVVIAEITKKDGSVKEVEVIDTNDYYTKEEIDNKGYINKDVDNLTNYTKTSDLSEVATSGSYNDLKDTPNLSVYSLITETGAKIDLEINSTTYVLTAKLYDKNNNLLSTSTGIDLPLETMVVGASYDSETKEIVLTLKNGQTVRFSVADLVSGLVSETQLQQILLNYYTKSEVDTLLSNKVGFTDYPTNDGTKSGVIKVNATDGISINTSNKRLQAVNTDYGTYQSASNSYIIGKGTLENVITGKELVNQTTLNNSQAQQDNEISDLKSENDYLNSIINQLPKVSSQGTILTLNNTINGRMNIELGTSELEQDGTPTPDNPYPIHTISGNNTIKIIGKNLGKETFDSKLYLSGTGDNRSVLERGIDLVGQIIQVKPSTSYTISGTFTDFGDSVLRFGEFTNIPIVGATSIKHYSTSSSITFTTQATTNYLLLYNTYARNTTAPNLFVCETQYADTYEPYVFQEANINLGDIEYCEIGDYKDEFVRDNEGNWGIRKNIGKVVLDGSEMWGNSGAANTFYSTSIIDYAISNNIPISNYYSGISNVGGSGGMVDQPNNTIAFINIDGQTTPRFYVKDTRYENTQYSDFKTWLSTHNLIVYYALETPTYTQITGTLAEQLENIYQYLLSYKGQTNISQVPNDLPFVISASALLDLNTLVGE